jgi:hypothetical protein
VNWQITREPFDDSYQRPYLTFFTPFDIVIPFLEIYPKAAVSTLAFYKNHS